MYIDRFDDREDKDIFDREAAKRREEQGKCPALVRDRQNANRAFLNEGIRVGLIMPGASGFKDVCMRYNDPDTMDIPMIIMSSKNRFSGRMWGPGQGAAGCTAKPSGNREPIETRKSA